MKLVTESYLMKHISSDLCAICLLHRWGLAHPIRADMVGDKPEKRFMTKIAPLLEAVRRNGGNHLEMKRKQLKEMIRELGLGTK
jgi:hypothetical protein